MLFNSFEYFIFLFIMVMFYYILSNKTRWILLLLGSYYFYMCWEPRYALLILFSTIITFYTGIYIEKSNTKSCFKKKYVTVSILLNLAILFFFKYFNFININLFNLLNKFNVDYEVRSFDILLPVGISFYTFQALSYTIDVYRGNIKAERNFVRYALFVSFFPQLVAGPIERSTNLLPQLKGAKKFNYIEFKDGALLILWGLIKKVVIADRLALVVNEVYSNTLEYRGLSLIIATFFFTFQIYCDFSSYSDIAIGSAKMFGITFKTNFCRPYFAKSIQEFWRRWHISLSSWFRDYLYFPLGGSRNSIYRNTIIVFLISGLWHGANWNFLLWGLIHGIIVCFSIFIKPLKEKVLDILLIESQNRIYNLFSIFFTFILVNITWILFRANSLNDSIYILKEIININHVEFFNIQRLVAVIGNKELKAAFIFIFILTIAQFLQTKIRFRSYFRKINIFARWSVYTIAILVLAVFGIYGSNSPVVEFIYFQF